MQKERRIILYTSPYNKLFQNYFNGINYFKRAVVRASVVFTRYVEAGEDPTNKKILRHVK